MVVNYNHQYSANHGFTKLNAEPGNNSSQTLFKLKNGSTVVKYKCQQASMEG